MSEEPRQLLGRLRMGDQRAFDAIYAQYRARIFTFLARLTGQRALAEDLVQETFLRLVRHATRLDPDTRLDLWLYRVAGNACRSHFRWALVDADRRALLARGADGAATEPSPFDLAAARELERSLERALLSLPLAQRELLILVAVERLPLPDVAELLGLRPDALRQRLSRARKLLAEALQRAGIEPSWQSGMVSDER